MLEPVLPYPALSDAIAAVLDELEAGGLGTWRLASLIATEPGTSEVLTVPIVLPDDNRLCALQRDMGSGSEPPTEEQLTRILRAGRLLGSLLVTNSRADDLGRRVERAERESTTDELTELPNARAWWRILSREADRCDRFDLSAIVAVVDLDNLKEVNDRDGHLAGDLLIRAAAHALTRAVATTDVVARLGGDEFGVLVLDEVHGPVTGFRDRLHDTLVAQGVDASVGACPYLPGGRINDAYHAADLAMYEHKRSRR